MEQLKGERLKALLDLYFSKYYKKDSGGTLANFARELEVSLGHPGIRSLFKEMIEAKVFVLDNVDTARVFYYIDKKKLKSIIDEQEILILHNKYLKQVGILYT